MKNNFLTFRKIMLLSCLLLLTTQHAVGQTYTLQVGYQQFLSIPDPPNRGYVTSASWSGDSDLMFVEQDEVGAIVVITHYFQGSRTVNVSYSYAYWNSSLKREMFGSGSKSYTIQCTASNASLAPTSLTVDAGQTKTIRCNRSNSYGTVKWSSNDTSVATIDNEGNVTGVKPGTATITCDPIVAPNLTCEVTVNKVDPKGVSLPGSLTVDEGGSASLNATLTPEYAETSFTWTSDDETIATVTSTSSGSTTVYGKKPGSTKIRVKTANGYSDYCDVTVRSTAPTGVSLPKTLEIDDIGTGTLTATLTPDYGRTKFEWWSEDKNVATVNNTTSGTATVSGVNAGTTKIWCKTANGFSDYCEVSVRSTCPTDITLRTYNLRMFKGAKYEMDCWKKPSSSVSDIDWSSCNPDVATVDQSGIIKALAEGTATITATAIRGGASAECFVKVVPTPTYLIMCFNDGSCLGYKFNSKATMENHNGTISIKDESGTIEVETMSVHKFFMGTQSDIDELLGIEPIKINESKLMLSDDSIIARGFDSNSLYHVYKQDGTLYESGTIESGNINISNLRHGVFVIKVGSQTIKVLRR